MIYTDLTKKAMGVCFDAHKNQKDKSKLPYVFHPFHLAEQMDDEESTIVALLHDVVEDAGDLFPMSYLESMGFGDSVIEALKLLTHDDGVPYMDYIERIKTNLLATKVKLADLAHNSDEEIMDAYQAQGLDERASKITDVAQAACAWIESVTGETDVKAQIFSPYKDKCGCYVTKDEVYY